MLGGKAVMSEWAAVLALIKYLFHHLCNVSCRLPSYG